jgi:hypothetical protein
LLDNRLKLKKHDIEVWKRIFDIALNQVEKREEGNEINQNLNLNNPAIVQQMV